MEALLTTLNVVFGQIITWVGIICTTIVEEPILLVTTGFLMVGGVIGIFGRLLSKN